MAKRSNTKSALFFSIVSMFLCFAMLLGTTLAWFTDSVTSTGNKIQAGTLKVDLQLLNKNGSWNSIKAEKDPIWDAEANKLWEPGYTDVKIFKIVNDGSLALKWKAAFTAEEQLSALANVIDVYVKPWGVLTEAEAQQSVAYPADRSLTGYTKVGTLAQFVETIEATTYGVLNANESAYLGIALHMQESADNLYQGKTIGEFDITIIATQKTEETDSFDNTYDENAAYPLVAGRFHTASAPVDQTKVDPQTNKTTEDIPLGDGTTVPAGVQLNEGVSELTLNQSYVAPGQSEAVIEATAGELITRMDIHMEGVSSNNTTPIPVPVAREFPKNLTANNIGFVHVENGVTVPMVAVNSLEELDAHNEFYYDPATGKVTLSMATFSEVVATVDPKNPWDGTDVDTSWYNTTDTTFTLTSTAQLAGFAQIVGGMAAGIERDSFADKTVKLGADMNMGSAEGEIFAPVGYYFTNDYDGDGTPNEDKNDIYSDVYAFEGIFDGQGHTISNILQRTWDIKGDDKYYNLPTEQYYNDGMGVFGWIHNGTIQNLAIDNFQSDGEFCTTGCVAAYSSGVSTFQNIRITNSNPRAYNVPNGGVVGYAYDETEHNGEAVTENKIAFKNIIVDDSNKVSALWGSWDVGCGGILGRMGNKTVVTMEGCAVAAEIDSYNDVCGNYQYYQYRYSGMLIGTCGSDEDPTDQIANVTCSDCHVRYGDWADYYYCELVANSIASYTHDYQFSRLQKIDSMLEIKSGTTWLKAGNFVYDNNGVLECYHIVNDNGTLKQHLHTDAGEEIVDGNTVLVENNQIVYIPFKQLYTGYGWGSAPSANGVNVEEYVYSITYMYAGKVYDVVYIKDNSVQQSTKNTTVEQLIKENTPADYTFAGWVTTGSEKLETVPANNTENITLYPSWSEIFTARFVDENGNVISEQTFTKATASWPEVAGPASSSEYLEFDHWEVRNVAADGKVTSTPMNSFKCSQATGDVTFYPYYNIKNGGLGLTGVDENGDGIIDYYTVEAVDAANIETNVEIPGIINGKPVKVITDLSSGWASNVENVVIEEGVQEINNQAFGDTQKLKKVELPSTITKLGDSAFAGNLSNWGDAFGIYDKPLEVIYNGTKAEWDALVENSNKDGNQWEDGLGEGAKVICIDGTYTMTDKSGGPIRGYTYTWTWTPKTN